MERINTILSIQNLSSLNYPPDYSALQMQVLQQLQQRHQQQQLQQQVPLPSPIPIASPQQQSQPHRSRSNQQVQNSNNINNNNHNNTNINDDHNVHHSNNRNQRSSSTASTNGRHARSSNGSNINGINSNHGTEKELIDLITCKLCKGYLIDAATIDLCMHTFCRPCAIKFIRDKPRCPDCNLEIKDKRYLNRLKPDITMQNIVYKLVPGLYESEMARRRKFYAARPTATPRYPSEMFGDIPAPKTIRPDDMLNISITWMRDDNQDDDPIKTYFLCRADSTILVLRKLIIAKFGLDRPIKIYYENWELFYDLTTLMDVAATYNWLPERKVLSLHFREQTFEVNENEKTDQKFQATQVNSSLPENSVPDPSSGL